MTLRYTRYAIVLLVPRIVIVICCPFTLHLTPVPAACPAQLHQPGDQQPDGQVVRRVPEALRRRLLAGGEAGALYHLHRRDRWVLARGARTSGRVGATMCLMGCSFTAVKIVTEFHFTYMFEKAHSVSRRDTVSLWFR